MRIYKLHGTIAAGTTNSLAQLDIVEDGKIKAVSWTLRPTGMDALDDELAAEISFASTNTISNNDVRQSISEVGVTQQFLTSGGGVAGGNYAISGLNINVIAGERIHLHTIADTGMAGGVSCYMYVEDGSGGRTRNRRLR